MPIYPSFYLPTTLSPDYQRNRGYLPGVADLAVFLIQAISRRSDGDRPTMFEVHTLGQTDILGCLSTIYFNSLPPFFFFSSVSAGKRMQLLSGWGGVSHEEGSSKYSMSILINQPILLTLTRHFVKKCQRSM